jgi:hypothetical protein
LAADITPHTSAFVAHRAKVWSFTVQTTKKTMQAGIIIAFVVVAIYTAPPLFPEQVTFTQAANGLYAIDVKNQRAFALTTFDKHRTSYSWLQKKFPYATPGSPQADHYVEMNLYNTGGDVSCYYTTYWQYAQNPDFTFPSHWVTKSSSGYNVKIGNYLSDAEVSSLVRGPDVRFGDIVTNYWRTENTCDTDDGKVYPCNESFFIKDTEKPFQMASVKMRHFGEKYRIAVNYTNVDIGTPKESLFVDQIPKNWQKICNDMTLGFSINPWQVDVSAGKKAYSSIALQVPPHNGENVVVQFKPIIVSDIYCSDCIEWEPKQMVFTKSNFDVPQNLTITYKHTGQTALDVRGVGGGYELLPAKAYTVTANAK